MMIWRSLDPTLIVRLLRPARGREGPGETENIGAARVGPCRESSPTAGHNRKEELMSPSEQDKGKAIEILNRILEMELAGVVRYTHYSFMVYGYQRIPIVEWLQEQADEGLDHAKQAGELVTHLGGHPSLGIGPLLETERHDIGDILRESLEHEGEARRLYQELLKLVQGRSVFLEEYARRLIADEEQHADQVDKMLRRPGTFAAFAGSEAG
jgi:bacterioferritin